MYRFESKQIAYRDEVILHPISLEFEPGSTIAIIGPSGCGKTTLLNRLAGLHSLNTGQWHTSELDIGYLFQEHRLLPWRTLKQNLMMVCPDQKAVLEMLNAVQLDGYAGYYPSQVSLGMARRASLARCLLLTPELVLMDEPLASLDMATAEQMQDLIKRLVCDDPVKTMVYVTHDLDEALSVADEVVVLKGRPASVHLHKRCKEVNREELLAILKA